MPQRRWTEAGVFTPDEISVMSSAYDDLAPIVEQPNGPYAAIDRALLREILAEAILFAARKGPLTADRLQAAALRRLTELLPG